MIYLLLVFNMVLWGMYPIFTHYFVLSLDPLLLLSVTALIASFPFIINLAVKKKLGQIFSAKNLKTLLPVALFAAIGNVLLFTGTKLTSGANTGLLLQVEPIYSLILGVIFFGEIIEKKRIGATLLMVIGAMTIVYRGEKSLNIGDFFILATPLMYQLSHTAAKRLLDKGADTSLILAGRQFYAGVLILLLVFLMNKSFMTAFSLNNLTSATFLGLYLSFVAFLWYTALKRMPVSVASSFLPLTALVSLLGSVFFLRETISLPQYVGFAFIVSGLLWFAKTYSHKKLPQRR